MSSSRVASGIRLVDRSPCRQLPSLFWCQWANAAEINELRIGHPFGTASAYRIDVVPITRREPGDVLSPLEAAYDGRRSGGRETDEVPLADELSPPLRQKKDVFIDAEANPESRRKAILRQQLDKVAGHLLPRIHQAATEILHEILVQVPL